ncbi:MAG TPA: hypothetical protein VFW87_07180 [Pirellulales bacterium]|nr:hypothetical protein [Pirellulales bacterium]
MTEGVDLPDQPDQSMTTVQITALEPGNRIQLPAEWATGLGISRAVSLERTPDGIPVRPAQLTWNEISANKLSIRPGDVSTEPDVTELSGDDLIF